MEKLKDLGNERYGRAGEKPMRVAFNVSEYHKEYILAVCDRTAVKPTDVIRVALDEFIENNPLQD